MPCGCAWSRHRFVTLPPISAGKLDAIPGHVNVLRIEADGPGEFKGVSAEFNGTGYLAHRFRVIAHDPAGWQQFLAGATE